MTAPASIVSRRIHGERLVLLGWTRAILMQLAHPLVAAGVAEHSSFRAGPLAAAGRLRHTVRAMLDLTFGDEAAQGRTIAGIRAIHDRVNGRLARRMGRFDAGTPYSAHDPGLLLWVHISLLESIVLAHEAFVGPVSTPDRDAYCAEAIPAVVRIGVRPSDVPASWSALVEQARAMEASGDLRVGDDASALARAILAPPLGGTVMPLTWLNRAFTTSTLPPMLREQYGLAWSDAREARLRRATSIVRTTRHLTPGVLARWAASRRVPRDPAA